jgi:hypothetical protein
MLQLMYFSKRQNFLHLLGLTLLGTLHYFQYYTYIMLTERLNVFTIQQRNYLMIVTRILGRTSLFWMLYCSTRRFLNFYISGMIFCFSFIILVLSFILSKEALNIAGMVVSSKNMIYFNLQFPFASSGVT